jgi:uncharacterized membrane protein
MVVLPALAPILVLVLLAVLGLFLLLVEVRVISYAYRKIGVRPRYVFAVMLLSLVGSHVNVPLYSVHTARHEPAGEVWAFGRPYEVPPSVVAGRTVVAVNVGGALIPVLVSLYLFLRSGMHGRMLVGVAVVAAVVHQLARIVPGVGIAVPMFVPPLVAAAVALALAFRRAPPLAYVSGSMGALIGADVMNLPRVAELGAPIVAIGGAGTFDGVFLTGIIAGLLA